MTPINPNTGTTPVTLTFGQVLAAGFSAMTTIASPGPPSAGPATGNPATFYDLTTTAAYSGLVQVCISFSGVSFVNAANALLYHYGATGWENITGSLDLINTVRCGDTASLSPFAIFEPSAPVSVTSGNFVYTPPAGSVLGAGSQTLSVTFTPTAWMARSLTSLTR